MTRIVVDKSADNAKPHSICLLPQSQLKKIFFRARAKKGIVTHSHEQRCLDSYRQRQVSQSDCEITSNCGKMYFLVYTPAFDV